MAQTYDVASYLKTRLEQLGLGTMFGGSHVHIPAQIPSRIDPSRR